MRRKPGPATSEERTELRALREHADMTGRDLSETVAVLAGRLADGTSPRAWSRRPLAASRTRAAVVARRAAGRLTFPAGSHRIKLAASTGTVCGLVVILAAAVLWQHRRRT